MCQKNLAYKKVSMTFKVILHFMKKMSLDNVGIHNLSFDNDFGF